MGTEKQKAYQREWRRRKVAELRAKGLCIGCGKRPPAVGFKAYCAECCQWHRQHYEKFSTRKRHREWAMRKNYGITQTEYERMLLAQGRACAICRKVAPTPKPDEDHRQYIGQLLRVDHDHVTGKVRALLCHNCNVALGNLQEDPALIARALAYLLEHREPEVLELGRKKA